MNQPQRQTQSQWQNYLRDDLRMRQQRNPAFSLRSYASTLGISPAHLSAILTGRRAVTAKTAVILGQHLGVTANETVEWLQTAPRPKPRDRQTLNENEFGLICEWYHFAILGLANLKTNVADSSWIAQKLGLPPALAREGFESLLRAGHLMIEGGQFRQSSPRLKTKDDLPSGLVRRFHKQVLQMASTKIDTVPVDLREFRSMTIGIDPKRLKAAKKMIREFTDQFSQKVSVGSKSEVYFLSLQFFPATETQT